MKINASIEARMTSTRLPGKVLKPINGIPSLEFMINRLKRSQKINEIIVATTTNESDDPVVSLCEKQKIKYFRGDENNVYERVLQAHINFDTDIIIELSGDCPFIDPEIIDKGIDIYVNNNYDYVHTSTLFPLGMATEIFSLDTLKSISNNRELSYEDKEHVTPYLYTSDKYKCCQIEPAKTQIMENLSVTLDTKEDYEMISTVANHFKNDNFTIADIIDFIKQNPHLSKINEGIHRKGLA